MTGLFGPNLLAAGATSMFATAATVQSGMTTGQPALDGMLVTSPVVGAMYLWVKSLQADKKALAAENKALNGQLLTLAETQCDTAATVRERLKRIERALELREEITA